MAAGVFTCVRCGTAAPLTYQGQDGRCCWCDGMDRGVVPRLAIAREGNRVAAPAPRFSTTAHAADCSARVVHTRP